MKILSDIPHLEGVNVLIRADFNVPVKNGAVADDYRIKMTLPTIDFLHKGGARIILISHLENIEGENDSLEPVAKHLKKLDVPVTFVKDWKHAHGVISQMNDGDCILLENLRFFKGEKANDPAFAKELASLADIYVNDGFSVSHREHASIVGVPKLIPGYAGIQLASEIEHLSKAFNPPHPFVFMLGGAKFETKMPLLQKFMSSADTVFVGGALASDFFREKGYETGQSLVSEKKFDLSAFIHSPKLILPIDVVTVAKETKPADGLSKTDKVMDDGMKTIAVVREVIKDAEFILWNGTLGLYEDGYDEGTLALAKIVGEATKRGAETIVGGGDTLAAISTMGLEDHFTFISTGGGAMLDFLAKGTLPGIEALNDSKA